MLKLEVLMAHSNQEHDIMSCTFQSFMHVIENKHYLILVSRYMNLYCTQSGDMLPLTQFLLK